MTITTTWTWEHCNACGSPVDLCATNACRGDDCDTVELVGSVTGEFAIAETWNRGRAEMDGCVVRFGDWEDDADELGAMVRDSAQQVIWDEYARECSMMGDE